MNFVHKDLFVALECKELLFINLELLLVLFYINLQLLFLRKFLDFRGNFILILKKKKLFNNFFTLSGIKCCTYLFLPSGHSFKVPCCLTSIRRREPGFLAWLGRRHVWIYTHQPTHICVVGKRRELVSVCVREIERKRG